MSLADAFPRDSQKVRVRLTVDRVGGIACEWRMLEPIERVPRVGFSKRPIRTNDVFQYHKTSHRPVYDAVLREAEERGWFDALVLNERGEVAEGARSNVFLDLDGACVTPPRSSGILDGVARAAIFRQRRGIERTITRDDVERADAVYISNSLRGLVKVEVER
jgi:para-aminobenzoate synthetase/4-amino-4-deoxychorismate lyase